MNRCHRPLVSSGCAASALSGVRARLSSIEPAPEVPLVSSSGPLQLRSTEAGEVGNLWDVPDRERRGQWELAWR